MQNLFKQAATKYNQGDFHGALSLYKLAGKKFGPELVHHNLVLCKQQLDESIAIATQPTVVETLNNACLSKYFDKVFVVNLKRDLSKRFKITSQLNKLNIDFELFEATNGYEGQAMHEFLQYQALPTGALKRFVEFNELESQRSVKFIESPGAYGYLKTYIQLLKSAKAQSLSRILILEDDVVLDVDFFDKLENLSASIGKHWKVLQLGASQYNWDSVNLEKAELDGFYTPKLLDTCGSFAMALDLSIADELIELTSCFEAPFDHLPLGHLYQKYSSQCFVAFPNIAIPDVSVSSIRESRNQISHSQLMKWDLNQFNYPLALPSISIVVQSEQNLKYWSSFSSPENLPYQVKLFAHTIHGVSPIHSGTTIAKYKGQFAQIKNALVLPQTDLMTSIHADNILTEQDIENFILNTIEKNCQLNSQLQPLNVMANPIVKDRVSVIIPTFRRVESLLITLESVASQCYQEKEIIIVDDNGLDTSYQQQVAKIVQNFKFNYPTLNIKYLIHHQNRNGSAARNTGMLASTGAYICFLDDDDSYLKGRLIKSIKALELTSHDVGAVYCGYINGNELGNNKSRYISGDLTEKILTLDYHKHYLHTNTVTYKREAVLALNGFDESYVRHQDLEFNLRFFQQYQILTVNEPLVHIRPVHVGSENKVYDQKMKQVKKQFLSQFRMIISTFTEKEQCKIYKRHWQELVEFSSTRRELKKRLKSNDGKYNFNLFV